MAYLTPSNQFPLGVTLFTCVLVYLVPRTAVLGALLALGLLSQNLVLAGQPARVWAVGDGEKVERDDLANRNRASIRDPSSAPASARRGSCSTEK